MLKCTKESDARISQLITSGVLNTWIVSIPNYEGISLLHTALSRQVEWQALNENVEVAAKGHAQD